VKNNESISFLIGKYIYLELKKNDYGYEIGEISNFDVVTAFSDALIACEGRPFETELYVYELLVKTGRPVEANGSIKLKTNFEDMRVSVVNGFAICQEHNPASNQLNLGNINQISNEYYNDVLLGPEPETSEGSERPCARSFYAISDNGMKIIRWDNDRFISRKTTTRHDHNTWRSVTMVELGDLLTDEHPEGIRRAVDRDPIEDILDAF